MANDFKVRFYSGIGARGPQGPKGDKGDTGATGQRGPVGYHYTPDVSTNGDLTWTNDGGLTNPDPVNLTDKFVNTVESARSAVNALDSDVASLQASVSDISTVIAQARDAVDGIEDQRDTILQSIADAAGLGTDTTLSTSGMAADAGAVGTALSSIDSAAYLALSATSAITIPDNSDFNGYKTAGTYKVTNNTHAATMTNMPAKTAGKLVVIALGQAARVGQIYYVSSGQMPIYQRFWNGSTWTGWERLIRNGVTDALSTRIDKTDGKVSVLYESGSFANGDATERISVYIPASVGYILYRLYHFIVPSINCNCWQVYYYYATDESFSNLVQLSVSGELECAIHLDGRDDFSGGRTHGDEVLTGISFFVNGVPTDITTYTTMTKVNSLRVVRTTTMYDPADHTTAIANHGVEYLFDKNGMTISQSLKWLVAAQLTNCFMAMFLPSKSMLDRAVVNSDFETLTLASTSSEPLTTITKQNGTKVFMWDTENPYSASVEVLKYPTGLTGGDRMSIGDNGGNTYNKVYFKVCGGGSSTVGELWQSKVLYKLNNG